MLYSKDQKKTTYSLLSINKWLDREAKQYNKSISQSIYQLRIKQLNKAIAKS